MIADSRSAICPHMATGQVPYQILVIANHGIQRWQWPTAEAPATKQKCLLGVKVKQIQLTFIKIPLEKYAVILVWSSMKKN